MSQKARIWIAIGVVMILAAGVLATDALRRMSSEGDAPAAAPALAPGAIPIHQDGVLVGGFSTADLDGMEQVSFVDAEDGVQQEGWLLRDILRVHLKTDDLPSDALITVSSSSRDKSAQVSWGQVEDPTNYVMLDLSNRGTLKLVSLLETLDTRDEWVQDVDKIEVTTS